jgi:hypothetical protein
MLLTVVGGYMGSISMFELLDLYYYHDHCYFLYADSSSLLLGDRTLDNIRFSTMIQHKKMSGVNIVNFEICKVMTGFQVKQSLPPLPMA